jgi:lactoylglutathione lyase
MNATKAITSNSNKAIAATDNAPAAIVRGLFEAHLHVADLERSMSFYGDVLGFELGLSSMDRRAAFYWIGKDRTSMLGLWEDPPWATQPGAIPVLPHHIAFVVDFNDLAAVVNSVRARGTEVRNFFEQITDEPSVFGWMPAAFVYFNDPDVHLLEFIALLNEPPAPELGVVSLSNWKLARASSPSRLYEEKRGGAVEVVEATTNFDRHQVMHLMRLADDSDEQIRSYLHRGRLFLLLDDLETLPIGQALALQTSDISAELRSVSIRSEHQRRGLGKLLVTAVLSAIKSEGVTYVTVATSAADLGNLGFYQHLGFRCLKAERDAFTPSNGYPGKLTRDGISSRDKIWFDRWL